MSFGFDIFIGRWLQKADGYSDNELAQLFDKSFTLYVIFSALYDKAFNQMLENGQITQRKVVERDKAVTHFANFLGHDELASELKVHAADISRIEDVILERKFYFNVKGVYREPDWEEDHKALLGIRSLDSKVYCESILGLVYRTRCNMFHGQKTYDAEQENVLKSMNVLLRTTINMALEKLGISCST